MKILYTMQRFVNLFGYKILPIKADPEAIIDDEMGIICEKCKKHTITSKERMYALYKATEYVINANIPGDFVECGVLKGGSAMVIAYTLIKMNETNRKIYLYDTYAGMSKPTSEDYRISNNSVYAMPMWENGQNKDYNTLAFSPLSDVRNNMFSTGYPKENLIFVKGKVEDTIPETMPNQISLLRLDTDWYESTKHELIHLFPKLAKGGVLIVDDYGDWAGAKKAVDEYFSNKPILLIRMDYTGRIAVKSITHR